jgi:hypothetical protein
MGTLDISADQLAVVTPKASQYARYNKLNDSINYGNQGMDYDFNDSYQGASVKSKATEQTRSTAYNNTNSNTNRGNYSKVKNFVTTIPAHRGSHGATPFQNTNQTMTNSNQSGMYRLHTNN